MLIYPFNLTLKIHTCKFQELEPVLHLLRALEASYCMLRISISEGRTQLRLVVEGNLVASWANELKNACDKARADLHDRKLVVDLNNLTAISQAGENVLLELMKEGVTLRCRGVFTKHVVTQLAHRARHRTACECN